MGIDPIVKVSRKVVPWIAISIYEVRKWSGGRGANFTRRGSGSPSWLCIWALTCRLFGLFIIWGWVRKLVSSSRHATRCIFFLTTVVPHMKFLWILSIWLLTWVSSFMYYMTWLGIHPSEDWARVVLHAMFKKWVFQHVSIACILSMMSWKSLLVGLLWKIGKLRYLPNDLLALMTMLLASLSTFLWWQFKEKTTLDIRVLTLWPDLQLKSWRVSIMVVQFLEFALAKRVRSSAKKICEILGLVCGTNFNGVATTSLQLGFNTSKDPLYTHNEDVGRHRVSMSNAPY